MKIRIHYALNVWTVEAFDKDGIHAVAYGNNKKEALLNFRGGVEENVKLNESILKALKEYEK